MKQQTPLSTHGDEVRAIAQAARARSLHVLHERRDAPERTAARLIRRSA
jgi:hypothetical protein